MGNERVNVCAKLAQRLGEKAGRGDAVDVEVTKNRYGLAFLDRALNAVCDLAHARDDQRVAPIPLKRGGKEQPALVHGRNTASGHDAGDERGDLQAVCKLLLHSGVAFCNLPARRGLKRAHGAPRIQGRARRRGSLQERGCRRLGGGTQYGHQTWRSNPYGRPAAASRAVVRHPLYASFGHRSATRSANGADRGPAIARTGAPRDILAAR